MLPKLKGNMHKLTSTFSLFTSLGTLLCCALPALLVSLGAGAALAGLVTNVPQLVWFSQHKIYFFAFATVMILLAGIMMYRARNLPCPTDSEKAKACSSARKISIYIYGFSVVVYLIGMFFAYVAQYLI